MATWDSLEAAEMLDVSRGQPAHDNTKPSKRISRINTRGATEFHNNPASSHKRSAPRGP